MTATLVRLAFAGIRSRLLASVHRAAVRSRARPRLRGSQGHRPHPQTDRLEPRQRPRCRCAARRTSVDTAGHRPLRRRLRDRRGQQRRSRDRSVVVARARPHRNRGSWSSLPRASQPASRRESPPTPSATNDEASDGRRKSIARFTQVSSLTLHEPKRPLRQRSGEAGCRCRRLHRWAPRCGTADLCEGRTRRPDRRRSAERTRC